MIYIAYLADSALGKRDYLEAYMQITKIFAGVMCAAGLAACNTTIPSDMTVAEYCADERRADQEMCRLKIEIDGNSTALADTNMRLSDARELAAQALAAANSAGDAAARAQETADDALMRANAALLREEDLTCTTRVIQQTDTGTCDAGYTVMSCTQTRYTTRAGGLSFIREIDDEKCRFNSQVLEMHVRCCKGKETPSTTIVPEQTTEPTTTTSDPLTGL